VPYSAAGVKIWIQRDCSFALAKILAAIEAAECIIAPIQDIKSGRPRSRKSGGSFRCNPAGKGARIVARRKGLVDPAALDVLIDTYQNKVGPRNGARVVARSWVDPAYKQRLLSDATAAIAEFGYGGRGGEHMVVVENTPKLHNLVVCTLCTCYPWPVLGLPPVWYKSAPYRSGAVIDSRGVLREFGLALEEDVEVRVWDSTAELRYLVLPKRPVDSEQLSEEALAALVTRDAELPLWPW
jgi:nitrile hydratase subunit alpha